MKKNSLLLIICLFSSSVFSLDFYLSPVSSYSNEYYSDYLYSERGRLLSQLEYKASYLFKYGLNFAVINNNFEFDTNIKTSLPVKCGALYDSDWQKENLKTSLSFHDLYSTAVIDLEITTKYHINLGPFFTFSPSYSLIYNFRYFSAAQGTAFKGSPYWTGLDTYVSWDSEYAVQKKVYGIDYFNNIFSLKLALAGTFKINSHSISLCAGISPYTYILSIDHHLGSTGGSYYQMVQKACWSVFDFGLRYKYKLYNESFLFFDCNIDFSLILPGDLYYGYFAIENIIADETSALKYAEFNFVAGFSFKLNNKK